MSTTSEKCWKCVLPFIFWSKVLFGIFYSVLSIHTICSNFIVSETNTYSLVDSIGNTKKWLARVM